MHTTANSARRHRRQSFTALGTTAATLLFAPAAPAAPAAAPESSAAPDASTWISLPQLSFRFKPHKHFQSRLDAGFSVTGFFFGLSAGYGP
jgi:hypothetical protein